MLWIISLQTKIKKICHFLFPFHVAYSQSVLWGFISYECGTLVSRRGPLYDRCLTLEIQRDPWLNGIRTNQCNQAGVWGKWGQRDTVCLPARRSFWQGLSTRSASACMEWQTADWPHECYIALRSPQMPHKEPGQECLTNLTTVNVMNASACLLWKVHNNQVYMFSVKALKSPLSISVRPNMSCRAYLKIYSLSMSYLFLLSFFLRSFSPFRSLPHSHSICQRYQPVSGFWSDPFVHEYQFINQSVHTLIGWG